MASSKTLTDGLPPAKRTKVSNSSSQPTIESLLLRRKTKKIISLSSSSTKRPLKSPPTSPAPDQKRPLKSPPTSPIPDQKSRIALNKSIAKSKLNLRICSQRVSEATAEGVNSVRLEELLVEETWLEALPGEFQKPYTKNLFSFIDGEVRGGADGPIYPPLHLIFNAFNSTAFDRVKVVIIGQDPYHGPGQAMGLAFSVPEGVNIPSSLVNIFKELNKDLGCSIPSHGNLEKWAVQGVLLLNTVLTVRSHLANSHAKKGWEQFTDAAIKAISQKKKGVVFLLWGNSAQQKARLIDGQKHHILKAAHPSGLSAHRGFFGCGHFSRTNQILEELGLNPIDWQL